MKLIEKVISKMRFLIMLIIFLISCKEKKKEPYEVPAIIYRAPWTQNAHGLIETNDKNGYIISGYTTERGIDYYDCLLMKVDKNGNVLKRLVFNFSYKSCGQIIKGIDNGYVVRIEDYILKLDENFIWNWYVKIPGGGSRFDNHSIISFGGYYFVSSFASLESVRVYKINVNGQIVDSFVYKINGGRIFFNAMIEKDEINNQILLAALYSKDSINRHLLIKLNTELETLWTKQLTFREYFQDGNVSYVKAIIKINGGYLIGTAWVSKISPFVRGFIYKIDDNGNVLKIANLSEIFNAYDDSPLSSYILKLSNNLNIVHVGGFFIGDLFWLFDDDFNTIKVGSFPITIGEEGTFIEDSDGHILYVQDQMRTDFYPDIILIKMDKNLNYLFKSYIWPED